MRVFLEFRFYVTVSFLFFFIVCPLSSPFYFAFKGITSTYEIRWSKKQRNWREWLCYFYVVHFRECCEKYDTYAHTSSFRSVSMANFKIIIHTHILYAWRNCMFDDLSTRPCYATAISNIWMEETNALRSKQLTTFIESQNVVSRL